MDIQTLKDQVRELAERHPGYDGKERTNIIHTKELEKCVSQIQELEKCVSQIQETIKIGNGYDTAVDLIVDLVNKVKSIEVGDENGLLLKEEEKALLIDVTKQFEETIINIQNGNNLTIVAA